MLRVTVAKSKSNMIVSRAILVGMDNCIPSDGRGSVVKRTCIDSEITVNAVASPKRLEFCSHPPLASAEITRLNPRAYDEAGLWVEDAIEGASASVTKRNYRKGNRTNKAKHVSGEF